MKSANLFDFARLKELRELIEKYNRYYYDLANPLISDYEYDKLLKELEVLEEKYPELVSDDSPTKKIGETISSNRKTFPHKIPMISLRNAYKQSEIYDWNSRIIKGLKNNNFKYILEPKIDGLGISLLYENGDLTLGLTRGDGLIGEDITQNIKVIQGLPHKLDASKLPKIFEVRGEVYMENSGFKTLNRQRAEAGEVLFANPRNAAAGSLKLLDPEITRQRNLKIFLYALGFVDGKFATNITTQLEFWQFLQKVGLPVNPYTKIFDKIENLIDEISTWEKKRDELDYLIDGMVIKIDSFSQQEILGETMKFPRWALAYKFPAKQATTKVLDIKIQVGRTGVLTPVANLKPLELSGVVIRRATLHNFDELRRLGVKINDTILLERGGEVIPKIVKVIPEDRTGNEISPIIPEVCPVCGQKIVKLEGEVALRCVNVLGCKAQLQGALELFASKKAMNIEGLGRKIIAQLIEKKLMKNIFDIYRLQSKDLESLELVKEKKSKSILEQIEKSKSCDLKNLIYGIGIRNVGEKASLVLSRHFKSLEEILNADIEKLENIREIGEVTAKSIKTFLETYPNIIETIRGFEINMLPIRNVLENTFFLNKNFVITGTFEKYSRNEIIKIIEENGGNVSNSVSKKTDFLILGKEPGSKYEKALKLNIKILSENEFEANKN